MAERFGSKVALLWDLSLDLLWNPDIDCLGVGSLHGNAVVSLEECKDEDTDEDDGDNPYQPISRFKKYCESRAGLRSGGRCFIL